MAATGALRPPPARLVHNWQRPHRRCGRRRLRRRRRQRQRPSRRRRRSQRRRQRRRRRARGQRHGVKRAAHMLHAVNPQHGRGAGAGSRGPLSVRAAVEWCALGALWVVWSSTPSPHRGHQRVASPAILRQRIAGTYGCDEPWDWRVGRTLGCGAG
eukprot:319494-Chlamydomonas_euryale.AAC.2